MAEKIKVTAVIPARPKRIYEAWLNGKEHSGFTGSPAKVDPNINGKFTAWDGYISGRTLLLEPGKRIVQTWRTTEFPVGAEDSKLEILFQKSEKETKITLIHSNIPEGQSESYKKGWKDYYFKPMKKYFAKK